MIKAIIFDCFGVLVEGSLEQFIDTYLSHDTDLVKKAHWLNDQASLGNSTYEQMLEDFAEMAELDYTKVKEAMDKNPRNDRLLTYIQTNLKDRFKIGFLSNASDDWLHDLFTEEDLTLFDDFVLSYQVGLVKPNHAIYELAANRLSLKPAECLFIDDIESYATAAREVGMQAFQYRSTSQTIADIEALIANVNN